MKRKPFIFVFGILLLVAAGYGYWASRPTQQDVIQKVFSNQRNFDIFLASEKVTAQLLHKRVATESEKLSGYERDAPVSVSQEETQKIKLLIQNPSSYLWNIANSCITDYGVLFTFHADNRTLRIAVCLKCRELGVFDSEDESAEPVKSEYITKSMREQLVTIAKSIFPNDPAIQSLKENRR
ncbi:MAG TPA: hypothetical protein VNN22_19625 [Verrucomicrobiae bacterium]|nr:hypothetical protein [Verrucomicrobiae bacterium]